VGISFFQGGFILRGRPGDLELAVFFSADLFRAIDIRTMLDDFQRTMAAMIDKPEAEISHFANLWSLSEGRSVSRA
jgi:hypothetical protein